jgi:hypothetical protein
MKNRPPVSTPASARPAEPQLKWAALLYFLLALAFFLPAFLPGRHIYGTDYLAGGYFFYQFISERLAAGELPKWVPYIFGGLPMAANPGSTYQPVHLLTELLLPTARVLAAVFVVHFWLAGVGTFLLAKELGSRAWVAFPAGIAFQFTGILASWVYAGHDGRIIVASLAPLLFFFLHRGVRTAALAPFAGAAATLGLALLSFQIQNSYYLLLAGGIWSIFLLFHLGVTRRPALLGRVTAMGIGAVAFGFLLAAVNFLPFLDYIPESPRGAEGGRGYEYSVSFSMPPGELLSLAVPEQHGASVADPLTGEPLFPPYVGTNPFKLHTEYVGALVLLLLALGFRFSSRDRYWWFFLGLALFGTTIALGGHTPLYRLYYEVLPGTKQFRAPSLSFFVVALSLVAMAALTLEAIARLVDDSRGRGAAAADAGQALKPLPWITVGVLSVAVLGMLVAGGAASAGRGPTSAQGWGRFALFTGLIGGTLWLWTRGRLATTTAAVLLALFTLADLWVIGKRFVHTVDPPRAIFAPDDVIAFLQRAPERSRIWTFPIPQSYRGNGAYGGDYPMLFGLDQVGGEHPNMLQRWNEYVGEGTSTYIDWHNLIMDPEVVRTPDGQALRFRSRPGFLAAANVRYIVSMVPLVHPDLREVHRGSALIYENTAALPRAYVVPEVRSVPAGVRPVDAMAATEWDPARVAFVQENLAPRLPGGPLLAEADLVEYEPDRVVVRTRSNREALLVLADNHYKGWTAAVDGREVDVIAANHTMRAVVIPRGEHHVVFRFEPGDLRAGLYITMAGFAVLLAFGALLLLRRRSAPRSGEGAG